AGVSAEDVVKASKLGKQYTHELATLKAIDPATLKTLQAQPNNQAAGTAAVSDIASQFDISKQKAHARLAAAAAVPPHTLTFLSTTGRKVATASAALKAVATVP